MNGLGSLLGDPLLHLDQQATQEVAPVRQKHRSTEVQELHSLHIYGRDEYRFEELPGIEALFSEPDLPPESTVIQTSYNKIKVRCMVLRESLEALAKQLNGSIEMATCFGMLRLAAGPNADIQLVYECDIPRIVIQDAERLGGTEEQLLALRYLNSLLTNCSAIMQDTDEVVTVINKQLETLFRKRNSQRDIEVHRRLSQVLPWIHSISTQAKQLLNDIHAAEPYLQPQLD